MYSYSAVMKRSSGWYVKMSPQKCPWVVWSSYRSLFDPFSKLRLRNYPPCALFPHNSAMTLLCTIFMKREITARKTSLSIIDWYLSRRCELNCVSRWIILRVFAGILFKEFTVSVGHSFMMWYFWTNSMGFMVLSASVPQIFPVRWFIVVKSANLRMSHSTTASMGTGC